MASSCSSARLAAISRSDSNGRAIEAWATTTAWGSIDELREVVRLARIGAGYVDVEVLDLADASVAHARLRAGDVSGRLVLAPGPASDA